MRNGLKAPLGAALVCFLVGCGGSTKPTIPTKLIDPPGADSSAGSPGKKKVDTDAKGTKQESGSDK